MSAKKINLKGVLRWTLRLFLTAACIGMLVFIFSNSLKTGEKSARQSSAMVDIVQEVASVVAPNSGIATATGADYDRLHTWVRVFAHFGEFAIFGALLFWCTLSYTWKKELLWVVLFGVFLVPAVDEMLQHFVVGRGAEFYDFCVDVSGGLIGVLFALSTVMFTLWLLEKRREKKKLKGKKA